MKNKLKKQKQRIMNKGLKKRKKILVPIDGSQTSFRALKHSIDYAKSANHKIIGLFVISLKVYSPHVPMPKVEKILKKDAGKFLQKAQKLCSQKNVQFSPKILFGNPGPKIVGYAKKNHIDEIILGHNNKGKLERFFLGSTSNYVLNKIKIPVTLIK